MAANANKKNTSEKVVGGWNVYLTRDNRTVMYDPLTKVGYIIQPKDVNNFTLYHNRIALAIALGMILASFMNDWKLPLVVGVVFFGMLELRYRKAWLPTLSQTAKFDKSQKVKFVDSLVKANNPTRFIILFFLYAAFGILMVVNGYQTQAPLLLMICDYCVLAACAWLAVSYLLAVIKIYSAKK